GPARPLRDATSSDPDRLVPPPASGRISNAVLRLPLCDRARRPLPGVRAEAPEAPRFRPARHAPGPDRGQRELRLLQLAGGRALLSPARRRGLSAAAGAAGTRRNPGG